MSRRLLHQSKGFTIIELLIASTVFSVVLLLVLQGITRIGRLYYKGLTSARVQSLGRKLSDEFTQQIQFGGSNVSVDSLNGGPITGGTSAIFCIGAYRYRVTFNRQFDLSATGTRQSTSVLKRKVRSDVSICDTVTNDFNSPDSVELADKGTRVSKLTITPVAGNVGLYNISIRLIAGDDDLLYYTVPSNADDPSVYQLANCRDGVSGGQFCADSSLSSTVERRVGI